MSFSQAHSKIKENEEMRSKSTPIAMVAPELKQYTEDTEITKTCAVLGCEESKNLNPDSFFRFPEDPSFRQIWTDLTGRSNWLPTDYSYICVQHFSVDCFECDANNAVVLNSKAVPSLKLPKHVLEVEYIDDETFDNEYEDDYDEEEDEDNQDVEMENDVDSNLGYLHEEHLDEEALSDDCSEFNNPQVQHSQNQHPISPTYHLQQKQQQINQLQHLKLQLPSHPQNQKQEQQSNQLQHQTLLPNQPQHQKQEQRFNQSQYQLLSQPHQKLEQQSNQPQHQKQQNKQLFFQKVQPKQERQNTFKNVQQDVSRTIKYLTNGTLKYTTEQPSTSKTAQKKIEIELIKKQSVKTKEEDNFELLKLFTEVQTMQRQATTLKSKLRNAMRLHRRQARCLDRLKKEIEIKKNVLVQRRMKKSRILLSLQDKVTEDTNGLVLAMPTRHTDDLKNFALSIYKYSPQAYIYVRNTLRTLLPSTDVLDSWLLSGYEPTNVPTNNNMLRVVSELTDTALSCKVSIS